MASQDFSSGCSEDKGAKFAPFPAHTKAFDPQAGANTVKRESARKTGLFSNSPEGGKSKIQKQQQPTHLACVVVNFYNIYNTLRRGISAIPSQFR
jgi:hypothetical protein